jgi:hypothetical protein
MLTTLKRIDIGSAFRVGVIFYGLIFAIFGLFFVVFQSLLLSGIQRFADVSVNGSRVPANQLPLAAFGLLGALCFYGAGIVAAAIFGGIQFAVAALCYNLTARWIGGIKVELETDDGGLLDEIERDVSRT